MIIAATCWSSGGFLVRQLSIVNAWEIVFWRSAFMTVFVAGVLAVIHRRAMPRAVLDARVPGLLAGAFLAATFFFFIGSLTRTTVANTNILMSVSPFLAALAARVILKEPVPLRTWIAMLVARTKHSPPGAAAPPRWLCSGARRDISTAPLRHAVCAACTQALGYDAIPPIAPHR